MWAGKGPKSNEKQSPGASAHESIIRKEVSKMLHWALIFMVIALVAGLLGFTGLAGAAAAIAKVLFIVFLLVCLLMFAMAGFIGKKVL
jgi:uncharacterized membrane protein YtjA (UPF0391 family)